MKCSENILIYSKEFFPVLGSGILPQHIYLGIHFADWLGEKSKKKKKKNGGETQLCGKISVYTQWKCFGLPLQLFSSE